MDGTERLRPFRGQDLPVDRPRSAVGPGGGRDLRQAPCRRLVWVAHPGIGRAREPARTRSPGWKCSPASLRRPWTISRFPTTYGTAQGRGPTSKGTGSHVPVSAITPEQTARLHGGPPGVRLQSDGLERDPMTERRQSLVVNISLSGPRADYDQSVEFLGRAYRIRSEWAPAAASSGPSKNCVSGPAGPRPSGQRSPRRSGWRNPQGHPDSLRKAADASPGAVVTDGHRLRNVLQEWTIRHLDGEMPGYFANARVVVLGGRKPLPLHSSAFGEHADTCASPTRPWSTALTTFTVPSRCSSLRLRRGLASPEDSPPR